jgi:hypothetical protein
MSMAGMTTADTRTGCDFFPPAHTPGTHHSATERIAGILSGWRTKYDRGCLPYMALLLGKALSQ